MSDNSFQAPSPEYLANLLPQYDIEFFIAQGGMGAVYKGRQRSLDRDIAIKVLPHEVGANAEFQESFISEAKSMARLNHSNLLGVFDYGVVDGMSYIVMEYVDGGSLHQAAWNQAVEATQAVRIVKGICDGLAHAHKNGIVHRDIKPSNILLTPSAEPKVADFGLAHASDSDKPGLVMGTPGYTAPEVFQDPNQAGELADIYSVGVILHQLLTGIDPAGSMQPPSHATGNIRLDAIWRKATNANPALRYPSVAAMADELEKWMSAKNKLATGAASPAPSAPRRHIPVKTHGGGGLLLKLLIIAALAAAVYFTHQTLENRKKEIDQKIADHNAADAAPPAVSTPVPNSPPVTAPPSLPTDEEIASNHTDPTDDEDSDDSGDVAEVDNETETEPGPETPEDLPPGDPALLERGIGLIDEARKKRDKELADNASALHFNLRVLSRKFDPDQLAFLEEMKEDIIGYRIPVIDDVLGLPAKIVEAFSDAHAKEESIDEMHRSSLTRIRDAYVTRLKGAATATSEEELKRRLLAQAAQADDLDDWVQSLSPEPEKEKQKISAVFPGSFIGKWNMYSDNGSAQWIASSGGELEIVGVNWNASWEILNDGTLLVTYEDNPRPYRMKRDGEGWVGTSPFGSPVSLRPGD